MNDNFSDILGERSAMIVAMRHGLNSPRKMTFAEIARWYKLSIERTRQIYERAIFKVLTHPRNMNEDTKINYIFSNRTRRGLQSANINTLGELATWHEQDILKLHNLGRKSLLEIQYTLGNAGLALRWGNNE